MKWTRGPGVGAGGQVGGQLLDPVLPAHPDAGGDGRADGVVGLYLGSGAQGDLLRPAPGGDGPPGRRALYPHECVIVSL